MRKISNRFYKAFINYKRAFSNRTGIFIPIFIHCNDIENVIKLNGQRIKDVSRFIEAIYKVKDIDVDNSDFVSLCIRLPLSFVVIVDALDEVLDKSRRGVIFRYLHALMESNQNCRWILSCRQEEYQAYAHTLDVANVQIKQMNLSQVDKLLVRRLKSYPHTAADREDRKRIKKTILAIADSNTAQEGFLRNPYYLSLWLYQVYFNENISNRERLIPSIDKLHQIEIKREIIKNLKGQHESEYDSIEDKFLFLYLDILSTLSFNLLKTSLKSENLSMDGSSIWARDVVDAISRRYRELSHLSQFDEVTSDRLERYKNQAYQDKRVSCLDQADSDFVKLLNVGVDARKVYSQQHFHLMIIFASVVEQAGCFRLLKLDPESGRFFRFLNQRAGDYLAAFYLVNNDILGNLLSQARINFWLFRTISISIAISPSPGKLLNPNILSEDPVLDSAIVNGLSLVRSKEKDELRHFIGYFTSNRHLLQRKNFDPRHQLYDPCSPLRVLRALRGLSVADIVNSLG